jgi:tRNA nucleotidyltransferase (CCA-adding enzyme)
MENSIDQQKTAYEIVQCLCQEGFEAYIAGGCVRDEFLESPVNDYDIVTSCPSHLIPIIFNNRRISHHGASFKVYTIDHIEVATYRTDQCLSSKAKEHICSEANSIYEDLARRDLTINSMAYCPYTGEVIDVYDGRKDLNNQIIRFTGNPVDRIREDPCRILRACRFLAKVEGTIDPISFRAMLDNAYLIPEFVAPERIRIEILKAMKYKYASLFFSALLCIDALKYVLPSLNNLHDVEGGKFHRENVWEHSMLTGDKLSTKNPLLKLAGYLHDIGKFYTYNPTDRSFIEHEKYSYDWIIEDLTRLKFSSDEIKIVSNLAKFHMRSFESRDKSLRKMLSIFKDRNVNWKDWLRLKIADRKANVGKPPYTREEIKDICLSVHKQLNSKTPFSIKDLAISGKDVMDTLNIKPGPEVGIILKELLRIVLDDPELNTRENLLCELVYDHPEL